MNKRLPVLFLLAAVVLRPAPAQLRINGYFSLDAVQGPERLPAKAWSIENLRGGLAFSGEWSPGFTTMIEPMLDPAGRFGLRQAWAGLTLSPAIAVKAGLFLVPFGKANAARRPFETRWISDLDPVGAAFPLDWREMGILAEGRFGNFNFAAFAGNGPAEAEDFGGGQQFHDNNGNKGWGGRLGALLSRSFEIGASYYAGRPDAAGERKLRLAGADAAWTTQNIRATAEYVKTTLENPAPFANGKAEGFFVLLELPFDRLAPLASYRRLRYEDPFHGPGFAGPDIPGAGILVDRTSWAFGLAYTLNANLLVKIEYRRRRDDGSAGWDSALSAQAAVHF